jgi:hypothetical protein
MGVFRISEDGQEREVWGRVLFPGENLLSLPGQSAIIHFVRRRRGEAANVCVCFVRGNNDQNSLKTKLVMKVISAQCACLCCVRMSVYACDDEVNDQRCRPTRSSRNVSHLCVCIRVCV